VTPTDLDVRPEEAAVLRPLQHSGPGFWLLIAGLLAVIGVGVYAYVTQLRIGLGVTGLNNRISWGIYVTNFVFFIGVSHAGTLISAILRVTGAEWRRPITRMAEAITVFALLVGAPMVLVDMGRPERLLNVFLFGRLQSPILWDVLSITTYVTGSLLYLYLPMIPDLAQLRDMPALARWRRRLYRLLAAGWRGTPRQHAFLEQGIGAMAIIIIPVAISVHTVVSWIFGMTLRAGWHSTIFGPYFVIGAIFSGIAAIITAMGAFRRAYRLERFLTPDHFEKLGYLLLTLNLLYLYFTISEYLTISYGAEIKDVTLIHALFYGAFSHLFWVMAVVGLILPAILVMIPHLPVVDQVRRVPLLRPIPAGAVAVVMALLATGSHFGSGPRISALWGASHDAIFALAAVAAAAAVLALLPLLRQRPVASIVIASLLVNVGMWLKRYIIVVPSMALPLTRSEWATYTPTWVEWSITAAAFATFILLYTLFAKLFPLVSLWEVREAPSPAPAAAHHRETRGIQRPVIMGLMVLAALALAGPAAAAPAPTRMTLTGPEVAELGDEIELEARLRTAGGAPIPEAVLEFRQVGAVGERVIGEVTTDAQGVAFLSHREYTVPALTLRVAFRGTPAQAASHADVSVAISGIEVEPSVVMTHSPGLAIKTTLFLLLGSVWLTYIYAASRVARVVFEDRRIPEGGRSR